MLNLFMYNNFMLQYVEKAVEKFRLRSNNSKKNCRNLVKGQTCIQKHLFGLFANETHCIFIEDVTITFIDKTGPKI